MDTPRSKSPHFTNAPTAELDDRFEAHAFPCSGTTSSNARDTHSLIHRDYKQSVLDEDTCDDRSPAAQNSVGAYANREQRCREDCSAAISSQVLADLALGLRRTKSRRPTFTEDQTAANGSGDEALTTSGEDICFLPPEESKIRGGIDFEEVYEFVADQSGAKPDEALTTSGEDICFLPPEESKIRGGIDFEEVYEFVADQSGAKPGERRGKISTCGDLIGSRRFDQIKAKEDLPAAPRNVGKEAPMSSTSPTNKGKAEFWNTPTTPRHRRVSNPDQFGFFSSEGDAMIHAPEIGDLPRDGETLHELFRGKASGGWTAAIILQKCWLCS
ncbi:unnamed protein product [Tuber aestivum]|uniref:Uncharacterized protein n=1 Tax=Tuber aestivum TaxID=59557 RepID=A0A292PPI4_9PEZI|nr:unnamed protein product [Tuber aestivum]